MTTGKQHRATSSLVALSSAAVLAVYTAGFLRTRSAAQRFAVESSQRRSAPLLAAGLVAPVPPPATLIESPLVAAPVPTSKAAASVATDGAARIRARQPKDDAVVPKPTTAPSPTVELAAADAVTSAPATTPAPTPAAQSAQTSADPAPPPQPLYKDGTYFGWGSSRHGDIQASVVVQGGRITSAGIAQCLTRYSCSWIAALPPQVVTRQSADVDYVSGATQSTNAFYYAIVDAVSKAK